MRYVLPASQESEVMLFCLKEIPSYGQFCLS